MQNTTHLQRGCTAVRLVGELAVKKRGFHAGTPPAPPFNFSCDPHTPVFLAPQPLSYFFVCLCDARLSKLSIYTLHAPHDCHALREHDGAHDLSGPMPVGALSAESCMVFAATFKQPKSLNTLPQSFRRAHTHNGAHNRTAPMVIGFLGAEK